jgi:hypothetical protein
MSNMWMVFNNQGTLGTYTFAENPSYYEHDLINLGDESGERKANASLLAYNQGIYHVFSMTFDNIGTAQFANFGTIFSTRVNIIFYPMDETRGTAENFTVRWMTPYRPKLVSNFWGGGYSCDINLESV